MIIIALKKYRFGIKKKSAGLDSAFHEKTTNAGSGDTRNGTMQQQKEIKD